MTAKVVDASALAAIAFQEADGLDVSQRLHGHELHAPTLLRYEMANIFLKKIRLYPQERDRLFEQLSMSKDIDIREHAVDQLEVAALAETFKLSAYDASYLLLAQRLSAELVTLDKRLEQAAQAL